MPTAPSEARPAIAAAGKSLHSRPAGSIIRDCQLRQAAAFFPSWHKQKRGVPMDVASWLKNLGLEQYEAIFRDNDIDASVLPALTNEDLKDIGVVSVGHRRKLLKAIALLRQAESKGAPRESSLIAAPEAERRQLTVMFCDLAGSTALSTRL